MKTPEFTHFGRYRIVEELGRGAMGIVYRAEDASLQRQVAVKAVLCADSADGLDYEARFRQEAKAAAALNHPNVITIHDMGREGEWLYLAMELLEGVELRELMRRARLPLDDALSIAAQVASALAAAHARGIVHRDIKPSNIMVLEGGHAKIMDFGIARVRAPEVKTETGLILGSPKYMSPEQVEARAVDHRGDIFSLGSILYEMTTGAPPFSGDEIGVLMFDIVNRVPRAPSELVGGLPQMLDLIVAKAMQKDPGLRYQDALAMAADLAACREALHGRATGATAGAFAEATATHVRTVPLDLTLDQAATTVVEAPAAAPRREPERPERRLRAATGLPVSPRFDADAALVRLRELADAEGTLSVSRHRARRRRGVEAWVWPAALALAALCAILIAVS